MDGVFGQIILAAALLALVPLFNRNTFGSGNE